MMDSGYWGALLTASAREVASDLRNKFGALVAFSTGSVALKADGTSDVPALGPDGKLRISGRIANIVRTAFSVVAYVDAEVVPSIRNSVAGYRDQALMVGHEGVTIAANIGLGAVIFPPVLAIAIGDLALQNAWGRLKSAKTEFEAFVRDLQDNRGANVPAQRIVEFVTTINHRLRLGPRFDAWLQQASIAVRNCSINAAGLRAMVTMHYVQVIGEPVTAWLSRAQLGLAVARADIAAELPELDLPMVKELKFQLERTHTILADGLLTTLYIYSCVRRAVVRVAAVLCKTAKGTVTIVVRINRFLVSCTGIIIRNRFAVRQTAVEIGRLLSSIILSTCGHLYPEGELARTAFTHWVPWVPSKKPQVHTHGDAAGIRSHFVRMAQLMASELGLELYSYQCSNSDLRKDIGGSRTFYYPKDLNVPLEPLVLPERALIQLVDVDYFVDMPHFLTAHSGHPVLLFTAIPRCAAGFENNAAWHFKPDGHLVTRVSGGASYDHEIWHYYGDHIAVESDPDTPWYLKLFSLKVVYYAMETRAFDNLKAAVLLTPIASYTGWVAHFARMTLSSKLLRRFNPIVRGRDGTNFAAIQAVHPTHETISIANLDISPEHAATVPVKSFGAARLASEISSAGVNISTVASYLPPGESARVNATVIASFIRSVDGVDLVKVSTVDIPDNAYELGNPNPGDDEAPPTMVQIMKPVDNASFHARASHANLCDGVLHRGIIPQEAAGKKNPPSYARFVQDFASEFAKLSGGTLLPLEHDDVMRAQNTTALSRSIGAAMESAGVPGTRKPDVFVKAEAYPGIKHPRFITNFPTEDKLEYARYILAAMRVVKPLRCYAFKQPRIVADHIATMVSRAVEVAGTDYTTFDARISVGLRHVDKAVMMAMFDQSCHVQLSELMYQHSHGKSRIRGDDANPKLNVDMGVSQRSGAMDTSLFNTVRNMYVCYAAMRKSGLDHRSAWSYLESSGCFGGDDGLFAVGLDFPSASYFKNVSEVCKDYGLVIKEERYRPGVPYTFLGRYFNWGGDRNSCADVKRQTIKLHLTPNTGALYNGGRINEEARWRIIYAKAYSIQATDANTPIIGRWSGLVTRIANIERYSYDPADTDRETRFKLEVKQEDNWPNAKCEWFNDVLQLYNEFNVKAFEQWAASVDALITANKIEEAKASILNAPQCANREVEPRIGVIIHGDTLGNSTSSADALKAFINKLSSDVKQPGGNKPANSALTGAPSPGPGTTSSVAPGKPNAAPAASNSGSTTDPTKMDSKAAPALPSSDGTSSPHLGGPNNKPRDRRTQRSQGKFGHARKDPKTSRGKRAAERDPADGRRGARNGDKGRHDNGVSTKKPRPSVPAGNASGTNNSKRGGGKGNSGGSTGGAAGKTAEANPPLWLTSMPTFGIVGAPWSSTAPASADISYEPYSPSYQPVIDAEAVERMKGLSLVEHKTPSTPASGGGSGSAGPNKGSTKTEPALERPVSEAKSLSTTAIVAAVGDDKQRPAVTPAAGLVQSQVQDSVPSVPEPTTRHGGKSPRVNQVIPGAGLADNGD